MEKSSEEPARAAYGPYVTQTSARFGGENEGKGLEMGEFA
jgi:hypothetical protein